MFRYSSNHENNGFENIRKGEYVAREPQTAIASETFSMPEIVERWNIEICYVDDIELTIDILRNNDIYFDVQT